MWNSGVSGLERAGGNPARQARRDSGDSVGTMVAGHLLSNVRYGIRGQIGIGGVDFFVEYDLNEMFQENQGAPELQRIQFGITF